MRIYLFFLDYLVGSGGVVPNPWSSFSSILNGGKYSLFPSIGTAQSMIEWLNNEQIIYSVEVDLVNYGHATAQSRYEYNTMEYFARIYRVEDLVMLKLVFDNIEVTE